MTSSGPRRWSIAVVVVVAALVVALLARDPRDPESAVAVPGPPWSFVVAADGAVTARPIDTSTFDFIGTSVVEAAPARDEVVSVAFGTNGVAQLLANGEVRWVGLADDGEVAIVERLLWRGAEENAPQPVAIGTAGSTAVVAIDSGFIVFYPRPDGDAARHRVWQPDGPAAAAVVAVGGAGGLVAFARGGPRLFVMEPPTRQLVDRRRGSTADIEELVSAGPSVLMRFDDGAVRGHEIHSGASYDVWPPVPDRAGAVAVAGNADRSIVVDADGGVHLVDVEGSTTIPITGGAPAVAVTANGDVAVVVLGDGSVTHVRLDTGELSAPAWPASTATAAGLVEPLLN